MLIGVSIGEEIIGKIRLDNAYRPIQLQENHHRDNVYLGIKVNLSILHKNLNHIVILNYVVVIKILQTKKETQIEVLQREVDNSYLDLEI